MQGDINVSIPSAKVRMYGVKFIPAFRQRLSRTRTKMGRLFLFDYTRPKGRNTRAHASKKAMVKYTLVGYILTRSMQMSTG